VMKVEVDLEKCEGHGSCVEACPEVFHLGDDADVVEVLDDSPTDPVVREKVARAVRVCPVAAIQIARSREIRPNPSRD
jgi:ferredoxin